MLGAQLTAADTVHLSVDAALQRAREANPSLRAERAAAHAAAQLPLQATQAFLPTVTLDLHGLRTTDPVAVFGLKLRQENFQAPDLDLNALNRPDAYSGYSAGATIQQPLFAPEGLFGFAAARRAAAAQQAAARRAAGATRFSVTQAYWDAQLAVHQVEALDTALTAVRAHVRQAEAMRAQGLVTGLDARLARLKASELEVRRLGADAQARNAFSALRALLALPDSLPLSLTDSLAHEAGTGACAAGALDCSVGDRGDLTALAHGTDAARASVRKAWASQLPSIAAFASFAHYSNSAPFAAGSGDWTIGVGLTWRPLQGLSGPGSVRAAQANHQAAAARLEAAQRQATVEVLQAERMLTAAGERADVAARAANEAAETLAQARLRYRTGASSITELLDVQAAVTAATLNLLAARHDLLVATAALELAYGVYDQ
jgi:outer membrane protein TolC